MPALPSDATASDRTLLPRTLLPLDATASDATASDATALGRYCLGRALLPQPPKKGTVAAFLAFFWPFFGLFLAFFWLFWPLFGFFFAGWLAWLAGFVLLRLDFFSWGCLETEPDGGGGEAHDKRQWAWAHRKGGSQQKSHRPGGRI